MFGPRGGGTRLVDRLNARAFRRSQLRAFNQAVLDSAATQKAHLMVTVKGNFMLPETLQELRARGVFTVNYYPDVEFEFGGFDRRRLHEFDHIVTTKSFQVPYLIDLLGEERVSFVHHGYSPFVHRRVAVGARQDVFVRDLLYVGNASRHKLEWLLPLAEAFPERNLLVVGNRWRELAQDTALAGSVLGHQLTGDFYAREIGRSRINIALHYGPVSASGWEDLVSTRTFEIPACGGFMLHIENPEVRSLFEAPSEIDTFATPGDLIAKVRYYLDRTDERHAIAARGLARAKRDHSLNRRAAEMSALIDQRMRADKMSVIAREPSRPKGAGA
ncbi:CgeB family protein [Sphingosinicella sp.]|uniref:CgeB family protein n=1 Tax=Sphingosinicella sp. TaxID=1917971 RepID=UPI0040379968